MESKTNCQVIEKLCFATGYTFSMSFLSKHCFLDLFAQPVIPCISLTFVLPCIRVFSRYLTSPLLSFCHEFKFPLEVYPFYFQISDGNWKSQLLFDSSAWIDCNFYCFETMLTCLAIDVHFHGSLFLFSFSYCPWLFVI